ncbi:endolytic transglycosylase MltG [Ghiorsea bivora]|uniref:endolytic transglycosylase MltG n=1 Tax=Ghiorsea bivora TaxID=1485545 RepID=UPI00056DE253|nr:endolytic transglycosylase MltG [Ghiorsea bivora]
MKRTWLILIVVVLVLAGSALFAQTKINQLQTVAAQDIQIPNGASSKSIARILETNGIISSATLFAWYTRLSDQASKLKPGLYHFEGALNMPYVLNILTQGKVLQFKVTIPEGLRTDEMLHLLAKKTQTPLQNWQNALQSIVGTGEYEGLFLPETYVYNKPIKPESILQQMYDARAKIEGKLAQELDWNEAQIKRNRIIASIVEKETALAKERVWVSAAIHNRLRKNMRLQMDPTVIYGMYRTQGTFDGNIRRKDLRADTPWNTYTRNGLPPTPICNPGAESLRAAAYPADVDYLYFVADGTGGHAFASTLEEHNANVRKWIRIERKLHKN